VTYVDGTLRAVRNVRAVRGVTRDVDSWLSGQAGRQSG
jgi:hypothetical protein